MIDKGYLQDLLPILKLHGVQHVKMHGLEISFTNSNIETVAKDLADHDSIKIITETLKKQEEAMPPDLRADALMDQDKVLNWSSPDQIPNDIPLPLTGEEDL